MYCPNCGGAQQSQNSRFCSSCGFLLSEVSQLLANGGVAGNQYYSSLPAKESIRKKGVKRGGKMILAGLVLVPLFGILSEVFALPPVLAGLTALFTFWGGILRIIYALIFEGSESEMMEQKLLKIYRRTFKKGNEPPAISDGYPEPAEMSSKRYGMWRETSDLRNQNPYR